jgi:perosamine synthetase
MIPIAEPWIGDEELQYATDAIKRGWISPRGEYVTEFEDAMAEFVGTEYAFATSSGTAALHLSLVAAGIGEGDEVIIPDLTWIACANVVEYVDATPVSVDVDRDTFVLSPEGVRDSITTDTAAVMPVHLYGQPCDMDPLLDLAEEHDLTIIEDAAEAHGASYSGRQVGSIGDLGCFSFYGNKIFTTGQGGMITTDNDDLAEKIRLYRRDGMSEERKYYHPVVGYNYRLTNVQAAIGVGQLQRSDEILAAKRRVAQTYREELRHDDVRFQYDPEWSSSAHWMTAPVFRSESQRNRIEQALEEADIETRPFFHPIHAQPPYSASMSNCPVANSLANKGLNLPSSPKLTDDEIATICSIIMSEL